MTSARWHVEPGTTICPECGGGPIARHDPDLGQRVWHWLRLGTRLGPTLSCDNGHEWEAQRSSRLVVAARTPLPSRALRVPGGLLRWLKHGRRVQPTPIVYVVAAAAGVVVGAIADAVLGWRWWPVVLCVVALVWLLYASSVFWGTGRSEFMSFVAPRRVHTQALARLIKSIDAGDLLVFGLDGWGGSCSIGGWSAGNGRKHSVSMRYEDADRAISISTIHRGSRAEPIALIRESVADNLVGATGMKSPPGLLPDEWNEWLARQRIVNERRAREVDWGEAAIVIDQQPTVADVSRVEGGSAAVVDLGEFAVSVIATGIDVTDLHVTRLPSVSPCLDKSVLGF